MYTLYFVFRMVNQQLISSVILIYLSIETNTNVRNKIKKCITKHFLNLLISSYKRYRKNIYSTHLFDTRSIYFYLTIFMLIPYPLNLLDSFKCKLWSFKLLKSSKCNGAVFEQIFRISNFMHKLNRYGDLHGINYVYETILFYWYYPQLRETNCDIFYYAAPF